MARLDTYGPAAIDDADKVLGVDVSDTTDNAAGSTKSFLFSGVWTWVLAKLNATATALTLTDPNGGILASAQTQPAANKMLALDGNGSVVAVADMAAVRCLPLAVVLGGNGAVITTGIKYDLRVPYAGTIKKATLLADQVGSLVVDIWKDTYANYPPTVADTITAAAKPTLSAANKSENATLTGWTLAVAAGDILRFNVDSAATITRATLILEIELS